MIKKLFSHMAIYGLVPQLPKLVSIFTLPIITRYLTPLDFGVYGLITAVIAAISVFSILGLNITLSNSFIKSPHQYKYAWRQIYGFLLLWSIPYCILISVTVWLFIPKEADKNYLSIILANVLPLVLFGPTSVLGTYYYQLKQQPLQIALRGAIFGIIGVFLTLLFIAYFKMGYMGWFWSASITQILMQSSYWYPVNFKLGLTPIFNFKWRFIRQQLKVGLPTVPHYYGAYLLNTSDRFVMKTLGISVYNIGLYNASNTVSNLFNMAGTAAGQAVSPMMSQGYKDGNEYLARRLTFILQILFLSIGFLVCLWLKEIFFLLIKNAELASTYHLGIILIMAYCYRPMYFGANFCLYFYERTKLLPKITLVAGVITVILNIIFIPIWGYQVAAYTTFIGLMYMGYSGYFMKDFKELINIPYYPLFWLLLNIVLAVSSYFLVDFITEYKIAISIGVLLFLLLVKQFHRNLFKLLYKRL